MNMKRIFIIVLLLGLFSLNFAGGHPGRTDKNGGHYNRKTGEYHYHSTPKSSSSYRTHRIEPPIESKVKTRLHPVVPSEDFTKDIAFPVLRTVDGDTVEIEYGGKPTTVRLIGVDTPETVHPQKTVEIYGSEASMFTRNLLLGEKVYVRFDTSMTDKYGRVLAYLYRAPDGLFVNLEIIRQGYGHVYTSSPFKYMELFRYYERRAQGIGKGLWGETTVSTSESSKMRIAPTESKNR